jgi:plasmid replication initiation protein
MKSLAKIATVRQSNELIEATYKIGSIGEQRLIRMLISQIHRDDEDFKTYRVSVMDYAKIFGLTHQSVHEQIEKSARALREREIFIRKGKSWLSTGWLSSAEYINGSGYVELCFDAKLKPYLLQLQGHFLQYELENIVYFKSLYSIRLYELLKAEQFKIKKDGWKRSFDYEDLRNQLGLENQEYGLFADFRINVIGVAQREINKNSDISIVDIDYAKTGRKVTHMVFHCEKSMKDISDETQLQIQEEVDKEKKIPDDVRQMMSMGITEKSAMQWRKSYGVAQVVRNIGYTMAMKKAGKIRESEAGFLATAIANDMGGGWEQEQQAKEQRRKKQEQAEKLKEDDQERKREESKNITQTLLSEFHALPGNEQESIRRLFEKQTPSIILKSWFKEKENNKTPEADKRFIGIFTNFYETYKANLQLPV